MSAFTLETLDAIVAARAASSAEKSYTKSLLDAGPGRTARKFGEEAIELVVAATSGESHDVVAEAADVVFHLLVLLRSRGVEWSRVVSELEGRTAQSGHAEKASRKPA